MDWLTVKTIVWGAAVILCYFALARWFLGTKISKIISKRQIKNLQLEREGIEKNRDSYFKGSWHYECLTLGIALWDVKIAIWQAFAE